MELNYKEIRINIQQQVLCMPVNITFQTAFIFHDYNSFETMYDDAHKKLAAFLKENDFSNEGPEMVHMDNGALQYYYPSYTIKLDEYAYSKLADYQRTNPELGGFVVKAHFSKEDQIQLFEKIKSEAIAEALKITEKQGLALIPDPEISQVDEVKSWIIFLPLSAKIDYSKQMLEREYTFVFKAINNE